MCTYAEIAQHLGVSIRTVKRMKDRGEIPYYQIGRQIRFKLSEVEEATKCQKRTNGVP